MENTGDEDDRIKAIKYFMENYDQLVIENRGEFPWQDIIPPDENGKNLDERMEEYIESEGQDITNEKLAAFWRAEIDRAVRTSELLWDEESKNIIKTEDMRSKLKKEIPKCPICGLELDKLKLVYLRSPEWTWEKMCGRAGWVVICPECIFQVHFHWTRMN
jgi:hypothetical protein